VLLSRPYRALAMCHALAMPGPWQYHVNYNNNAIPSLASNIVSITWQLYTPLPRPCCHALDMLWPCPGECQYTQGHGKTMHVKRLLCQIHGQGMHISWQCLGTHMPLSYPDDALVMPLPCSWYALVVLLLPCPCHALAMLLT
jgi:hypothetical protein